PGAGGGFIHTQGHEFLSWPSKSGGLRLIRFGRPNERSIVRPVNIDGYSPVIRRVLATPGNNVVLLGSAGVKPIVEEIDPEGKTIAQYRPSVEGAAVSAAFEAGGDVVVACELGAFPDATAWVGRVSSHGPVSAQKSFPGRPADMARGSKGSYVILIEQNGVS